MLRTRLPLVAMTAALLSATWAGTGTPAAIASGPFRLLYGFTGETGGEYPSTELVFDATGSLFGTTVLGGTWNTGTVFELKNSPNSWRHSVLHHFTGGTDGGQPYGGVTVGQHGELFGTTVIGGTGGSCPEDGCGLVYQLTKGKRGWHETVIHDFAGADGSGPGAGVTMDENGDLFGMTPTGGAYGFGVIYELAPDDVGGWTFSVVHDFTGGDDGAGGSAGRLLIDGAGHLFGVATAGGRYGQGTMFEVVPANGNRNLADARPGTWALSVHYAFRGEPDAGFPYGALRRDASGNFYGTTYYDGANDLGSVYELTPTSGEWIERVLYSFEGGSDGSRSVSNVLFDRSGNLYGTTSEGGDSNCSCGTIFELMPQPDGSWSEATVHRFAGGFQDGASDYNGLVADAQGRMFGATVHGGSDDDGTIYRFAP